MGLPYTFATLNLTLYQKDAQGNYVIPASALDDNFSYVLARTWIGITAPTDTTKYCFWLDTSVSPNNFKIWDGNGWVNSYAGLIVRKNTGANIGQRPRVNFIEGSNIGLTIADDAVDNEIDVTVNGNVTVRKNTGANVGTRPRLNFIEGSDFTLTIADDATDNEVDITLNGDTLYPSIVIAASLPTERSTISTTYIKVKEFTIKKTGNYRVYFSLSSETGTYYAYGRIYKNGIAYGTERSTLSTTWVVYSENLAFVAGDLCQLYYYTLGGGSPVHVKNFNLGANIFATEDID